MRIKTNNDLLYANKRFIDLKHKLINKNSESEKHFVKLLKDAGIYFIREKCNFKKTTLWCYYDFYIPRLRLYVEIDGNEHLFENRKCIDIEKELYVKRKGCFLIRFTNEYIKKVNSITKDFLLDTLFLHTNKQKYYKAIKYVRVNQRNDVISEYGDKIYEGNIYFYSHEKGLYYKFNDIYKCIAYTGLKPKVIIDLINNDYKKSNSRVYVVGKTLLECEMNVMKVFC